MTKADMQKCVAQAGRKRRTFGESQTKPKHVDVLIGLCLDFGKKVERGMDMAGIYDIF